MKPGDIVLIRFPQTDLLIGKLRPALVAAIANEKSATKLKAFTIGFEGEHDTVDELHYAQETADIVNIYANHGVPMNVLIESFELPFDAQADLDVGYQPMTMLPVGTNFIEEQRAIADSGDDSKQAVNTVP